MYTCLIIGCPGKVQPSQPWNSGQSFKLLLKIHIFYLSLEIKAKSGKTVKNKLLKKLLFFFTPQTESWDDNVEDKVAKQCLRPPNPKHSRGSKTWIAELHKGKDGLVDEQDHEKESQDDAVLLQGDQGLAITRDFVGLGHSVWREVEVQDAEQDKKKESQTDQFGLQWEGLEVFKVGDFLLAAKLPCGRKLFDDGYYLRVPFLNTIRTSLFEHI